MPAIIHQFLRRDGLDVGNGAVGSRVAQGLRTDPVLAEIAVKIAAEHAEGHRTGAGKKVHKGFFFDRVNGSRGYIPPGNTQLSIMIEAHFTYSALSGF